MTLYQIINTLKGIALTQPNVKSATDGSVYDVMNTNPSVKYDVVHFSQTSHQSTEEWDYYGFNIFYISRLEDSLEDNRLQIQSIGKEVLDNIIRTFAENWSIPYPVSITYIPFTQKFADLTAGVYCTLRLDVPKDIICADDYLAEVVPGSGIKLQDMTVTITENGLRVFTPAAEYDGIGEIRIVTDVPQYPAVLQEKSVEYTENGSYTVQPDSEYDGLSSVSIDVLVPDRYDEGYQDGERDGEEEQRAKLAVTSFTGNSTYIRDNGWSAVTVNVETADRYDEGYQDGQNAQKALLSSTSFTTNDTYENTDGWSSVTVDVEDRYDEGYNNGYEDRSSLLTTLYVTENGQYISVDGYSAITVDVPSTTAYTDLDLIANLQGDYYVIPDGTDHLRQWAFYHTCFSGITIPDSVRIINAYAFAENTCLTSITIPSGVTAIGSYVFSGDSALTEMTFEGMTPPALGNSANSLGSTDYTFPIYVPCEAINDYKTAWPAYASRIQCIPEIVATSITLNVASSITDTGQATVTVNPNGAITELTFSSSDTSKAVINSNGTITVLSSGTVTFCVYDAYSQLQDCKTVNVSKSLTYITAITFTVPSAITDSANTSVSYSPSNAVANITYTSSDTSKATINSNGKITVLASGTVTFCAIDTYTNIQSCKSSKLTKTPPMATAITFNVPSAITDSATTSVTVKPSSAVTNIVYSSKNTSRGTINSNGVITVVSTGSATFCATDTRTNLQSCKTATLYKSATGISISIPDTVTDTGQVTVTVTPSGSSSSITYSSSDTTIATVNSSGVITVKKDGTVTICATETRTGLQACKTITVRKSASSIVYTANTSTIPATGATRTITYDTTGFDANSFGISISGATGATWTKSGNVYTIVFPATNTTSQRNFVVTLTATTYGGATKTANITYTQDGLPEVGGSISAIYNVTSTSDQTFLVRGALANHFASLVIDGVTYAIPAEGETINGLYNAGGYSGLWFRFSSTGRKTVKYNVKSTSPLVSGTIPQVGQYWIEFRYNSGGYSSLVSITFGSGITYLMDNICATCTALSSVTLNNTVRKLGNLCFAQCTALNGLTIPSGVTYIGQQILLWTGGQWSGGRTITIKSTTPCEISPWAFDCENSSTPTCNHSIKVPSGTASTYKSATNWSYYANKIS